MTQAREVQSGSGCGQPETWVHLESGTAALTDSSNNATLADSMPDHQTRIVTG
jgi:hypothetical protein